MQGNPPQCCARDDLYGHSSRGEAASEVVFSGAERIPELKPNNTGRDIRDLCYSLTITQWEFYTTPGLGFFTRSGWVITRVPQRASADLLSGMAVLGLEDLGDASSWVSYDPLPLL